MQRPQLRGSFPAGRGFAPGLGSNHRQEATELCPRACAGVSGVGRGSGSHYDRGEARHSTMDQSRGLSNR